MLNSSYNLNRLGSPTAGDLINSSVFDACGGSANYYKPSPPFNMYDPNLAYNNPMHCNQLPRRRYSIGGLPSATATEYLNLHHQPADANLTNLLNEAKTSITRSSQILSRGEDLSGDILLSAAVGDVIADMSHRYLTNDVDITGANILNQLPITYSSQPNIYYSQPNYTNSQMPTDLYLSRLKRSTFGTGGNAAAAAAAAAASSLNYNYPGCGRSHLTNPILTAYTNPYYNSNTNMMNYSANYNSLPYNTNYHQTYQSTYNPKYNQPPPPYSSVLSSSQVHQPSTNHYFQRPLHYTSNPVLSQSSNYYFKHPHQFHSKMTHPNHMPACAQTSTTASYLHHQNQHPYSGYANQHFDHLNNSNCYSKLDLVDYNKQSEQTKRQVSFNIDVDTLSITS